MTRWDRLPAFSKLCDAISDSRLAVVTGAGVSLDLRRASDPAQSLPGWTELLSQIRAKHIHLLGAKLNDVDQLIGAGRQSPDYLIEAAEILRETVGDRAFKSTVVEMTTPVSKTTTATHEALERLLPRGFITFNYDEGHENADSGRSLVRMTYDDREKLRTMIASDFKRPFVLKAHGCVSAPATIVLDRRSYRRVLGEQPAYRAFLEHLFSRFNMLIVGFGMRDPDFEDLMRTLELTHGGALRDHIYIYKKDRGRFRRANELMLERRFGLIPIGLSDFKQLPDLLKQASSQPGPALTTIIQNALEISKPPLASHRLRRSAHEELKNLSPIGKRLATEAFRSVAANTREKPDRRAEAAYAMTHISGMTESTADFLFDLILRRPHPEIAVHAAIGLQRYSPSNLTKSIRRARALMPMCDQVDRDIARAGNRGGPRARLYLESAIAKWEATLASRR